MPLRAIRLGFSALASVVLTIGGCASSVPRRASAPPAGNQGESWDLVLSGPLAAAPGDGPESSRRDEALQWTPADSLLTRALAEPRGRPTLLRSRRLSVPRDPNDYIYFLDQYGGGGH